MRQNQLLIIFLVLSTNCLFAQAPLFKWAKSVGGSGLPTGFAVTTDNKGNVYTTGTFRGSVDFDPGPGVFNLDVGMSADAVFISKIDSNGQFVWAKNIVSQGYLDRLAAYSIAADSLGNIYITGRFLKDNIDFDPGPGVYVLPAAAWGPFVLKLDTAGNFIWVKSFKEVLPVYYSNNGFAITADAAGNTYTTGVFSGTVDFDPGPGTYTLTSTALYPDAFVVKLDASGNYVWAKQTGNSRADYANSICLDNQGNVYTTGIFNVPGFSANPKFSLGIPNYALNDSLFVCKMNNAGNTLWTKFFRNDTAAESKDIAVDAAGNVYTTGRFTGTVDFDPGPATYNISSLGWADLYVSKLDAAGNFVWAKRIACSSNKTYYSGGEALVLDKEGNIYTTGYFAESADFDPGSGVKMFTAAGLTDIYLLKLDASGNFLWASQIGSPQREYGFELAVDPKNNIYVTGIFNGTSDFDPGPGVFNMEAASGLWRTFVLKLGDSVPTTPVLPAAACKPGALTKIYPNPCGQLLQIDKERTSCNIAINIYNILGQRVITNHILRDGRNVLPVPNLPAGMYFYEFTSGSVILGSGRFVKAATD